MTWRLLAITAFSAAWISAVSLVHWAAPFMRTGASVDLLPVVGLVLILPALFACAVLPAGWMGLHGRSRLITAVAAFFAALAAMDGFGYVFAALLDAAGGSRTFARAVFSVPGTIAQSVALALVMVAAAWGATAAMRRFFRTRLTSAST